VLKGKRLGKKREKDYNVGRGAKATRKRGGLVNEEGNETKRKRHRGELK